MNQQAHSTIERTCYNREQCQIGIVHVGYGAFHRAHQAVYVDDYMEATGDLNWGIAAVNLRPQDSSQFARVAGCETGYLLKTTTHNWQSTLREIRSHVRFADWSTDARQAEELLCLPSVSVISMTVTESGYYLNDDWSLNSIDPVIAAEINGAAKRSVYAFLAAGLKRRMDMDAGPVTILCCDNIRSNGEKLGRNFLTYLELSRQSDLAAWLENNATFPNSMVDRITPRSTGTLRAEIAALALEYSDAAIHGENYIQWVLNSDFAGPFPALDLVGVEFVEDVDPYEEAKIRILNGGHTALCYLGALAGHRTFDEAMADRNLRAHFDRFELENVLPGLTLDLPFDKGDYLNLIAKRFSNAAIADDLGRICMDGWSKFPIFIRPTLKSCLSQGISPMLGYDSIASWYVFARRYAAGKTQIDYIEPYWEHLKPLLRAGREAEFAKLEALWSDLPSRYEEFVPELLSAIEEMEEKWPT